MAQYYHSPKFRNHTKNRGNYFFKQVNVYIGWQKEIDSFLIQTKHCFPSRSNPFVNGFSKLPIIIKMYSEVFILAACVYIKITYFEREFVLDLSSRKNYYFSFCFIQSSPIYGNKSRLHLRPTAFPRETPQKQGCRPHKVACTY